MQNAATLSERTQATLRTAVLSHRTLLASRGSFQALTGLSPSQIYVDPIAPFALPVATGPRFTGAGASLDCPCAWLPAALLDRRPRAAPRTTTTSTRLRAAAATIALISADLWRPQHGFTHIGDRYGIRFDCPDLQARIAAWQAGHRDGLLDAIEGDLHRLIGCCIDVAAAERLMPLVRARQRDIAALLLEELACIAAAPGPRVELDDIIDIALDTIGDLPSGRGRVADDLLAAASLIHTAPGRPSLPLRAPERDAAVARIDRTLRARAA